MRPRPPTPHRTPDRTPRFAPRAPTRRAVGRFPTRRLHTLVLCDTGVRNTTFGKANVALWRMSAAVERREPGQVLAPASMFSPDELPVEGRRAQYFVGIGRAHAMRRDHRESLYAPLRAEYAAPQHVRGMAHVRELLGHMMRSARRDLTTDELGRPAQRVGAVPA